ncbi:fructose-1,6-bisphosphatase, class II [Rhodomicrobium vannielii ATCC 17100]|uniref:Fructose-1,6-bisphosphatase n=1 Tax=Rhodomicrobium vannielii (strain ATCC 17100 / DSM 162 / LMG 4299 / NCIMB 10020 / ATH 3.1.1) TaxID=648757 RepID=E3I5M5_RHOVT|nr:class II fructose-bisphosphatase [Rhodomicrobium vannielii]ADP72836.1 fructose-1,6-bisphosphatase, class II [Rhodomicrobium vannielii ATCC 17100]
MANEPSFARPASSLMRTLSLDIARVTEGAAVAAAKLRGRGDERQADAAAVAAMHRELADLAIDGRIVIGEGERDDVPLLYEGEELGVGGQPVDIAVDPLEGTTLCAKSLPGALAVVAMSERDCMLKVPDVYMEKIAIGPGYEPGLVSLERSIAENLARLASAKGGRVSELTACVLDRPRHARLIEEIRSAGAAVALIGDGDIAGVIQTCKPDETGIDIYLGTGGAAEGVLAAAALVCLGGQIEGRLSGLSDEQARHAESLGIENPRRIFRVEDMVSGDIIFAATGVTDGSLLPGARFFDGRIETHTVIMRSSTRTVRWIRAEHLDVRKFER